MAVARHGSMNKAARELRLSQPAVSGIITTLEHAIGERLLDRNNQGVEPTRYGKALLKRSLVVFDELKQGIREIEHLADPTVGELRIGCIDSIASTMLPRIIETFAERYPQVVLHVDRVLTTDVDLMKLRGRSLDLVLVRYYAPFAPDSSDLDIETLLEDYLVVVCGRRSRFVLTDAFRSAGLEPPNVFLYTFSVELRTKLVATGRYIAAFARSVIQPEAERSLRILPIAFGPRQWPIVLITLKRRALNPVAQRFIEHLRDCTKNIAAQLRVQ
jgi:DNA-binding transcriptional LysR family regulator